MIHMICRLITYGTLKGQKLFHYFSTVNIIEYEKTFLVSEIIKFITTSKYENIK